MTEQPTEARDNLYYLLGVVKASIDNLKESFSAVEKKLDTFATMKDLEELKSEVQTIKQDVIAIKEKKQTEEAVKNSWKSVGNFFVQNSRTIGHYACTIAVVVVTYATTHHIFFHH